MTDFEREDMELKSVMGGKYLDVTREPKKAESKNVSTDTTNQRKSNPGAAEKAVPTVYSPFNAEPSFTQKLMTCAKWSALFGGLSILFFYWQQTGQMQPSAAQPCMLACAFMVGWSFGKYVFRGEWK
jgi:hypothetical protein